MSRNDFRLRYSPPGPIAGAFMASTAPVAAIMGPIGSGKTSAALVGPVFRAMKQKPGPDGVRRYRFVAIRDNYRNLQSTTIASWQQWFPPTAGDWNGGPPAEHRIAMQLPDGSALDFEARFVAIGEHRVEDVLRGFEFTEAYINEADLVAPEVLMYAMSRAGRYPSAIQGGATWSGVRLDFNAPDDDHWLYKRFVEAKPESWQFFRQPSGFSPNAENLKNLPPDYYTRAAEGQPDWFVRRMIRNEWGYSRDGQPVFPEFSDQLHVASEPLEPLRSNSGRGLIVGADAGRTPSLVVAQETPWGQWQILDELVCQNMGAGLFGDQVNGLLARRYAGMTFEPFCDPSATHAGDQDEQAWAQILSHKVKKVFRPAPGGNGIEIRLEAVRQQLTRTLEGGRPGLLLSPTCRWLRKGFNSGYRYRRLQVSGGTRYDDKPEKNDWSHPHDALQYALLGGGAHFEVLGRARSGAKAGQQTHAISD